MTKWTGERVDTRQHRMNLYRRGNQLHVGFADEHPADRFLADRLNGRGRSLPGSDVVWYREGSDKSGSPLFAEVNGRRQANCMLSDRCQVCGETIKRTTAGLPWLFSETQWQRVLTFDITDNPPTCKPCMRVAVRLCPHLRSVGARAAYVARHFPVGVSGDLYSEDGGGMPERGAALFGSPDITRILAKKLLVGLQGITEFEVPQ